MNYTVAVITPTYNRIAGLERVCDSLDAQTRRDWRHYIVVDGDPKTSHYLKHRAKTDKAMKSGQRVVIDLPENHNDLGVTPLNEGLKASTEPLWCVLADDNFFLPHHLNILATFLERNKEFGFVYGNTILKHKNIPELYLVRTAPRPEWNAIYLGEPVYRRELYDKYGPYKHEDDPESGEPKHGHPGGKYSYDWHFIRKCLDGGTKWNHINGNPSLVWFLDNKHIDPERFNHKRLMLAVWRAGDGGCAHYRLKSPLNILHDKGIADVKYWEKGMNWAATDVLMTMSDVLIFQGISSAEIAGRMRELGKLGKVCIVDADDWSFALDPDNPKYKEMGAGEVTCNFDNKDECLAKLQIFIDGMKEEGYPTAHLDASLDELKKKESPPFSFVLYKNGWAGFDLSRNTRSLEGIGDCYRNADALTCTTEKLASKLRLFNDNVFVLPNCVDLNTWRNDLKIEGDGKTRIFWSGGHSHYLDLLPYRDVLAEIIKSDKNLVLSIMGFCPPAFLDAFPEGQVEKYPWADLKEHPYRVHRARPDIGIIPLRQSDFADCKSPIKFLELAALGVPCVVSNSPVYNPLVLDGANGYLFDTPDELKSKLTHLLKNELDREAIGKSARFTAERYDINKRAEEWLDLYEYLWLKKNWDNPTKNTLYPYLLAKWEKVVGHKITAKKQLEKARDSRGVASAPPAYEAAPALSHNLVLR